MPHSKWQAKRQPQPAVTVLFFSPQGMPLATELEATIDTLALQNIQGLLDEGSDQTPTAGPAQATLISAAAEFRIANYDAADIDQFVFFQS